ncbi:hypothetical protein B566_EDAN005476 [Ephemera danica]|nr:hypothetical protein B566_EDAN005476 [Ephemera danica]
MIFLANTCKLLCASKCMKQPVATFGRHFINGRSLKGLNLEGRLHYTARLQTPPCSKKSKSTLFLRVALGWTAGYSFLVAQKKGIIFCKARASTRLAGVKDATAGVNEDPPFDWKKFFALLIPHIWHLIAAVMGSFIVAALNIQIPQVLGSMVNIMASVASGQGTATFATDIRGPALKLIRLYISQIAQSTCVCEEAISNIRTVRAFAMESQEQELFTRETDCACVLQERLGMGIGMFQGGTNLFLNCIVLGTLWSGGRLMANQQLAAGDLMAFLVASQTIQRSVAQISLLFGQMVRGLAAGARVFETVLKDFTLKIPAGKMVAIVGASGGGKSTIAALLESGRITLDTFDIKKLDPTWLRGRAIGFINQEPVLFATSIMENIRYGRPNATDQEVIAAARKANAHEFIQSFPEGYNTIVGERGVTVSGGQKQRIAIARALLKEPSILILDEATSALDTESERIVQAALDQVVRGRTVLVIAHRLSTIRNADIIAVLGNDSSLRRKRGLYWTLVQQQERLELEEATAKTAESGKENSANESEPAKNSQ